MELYIHIPFCVRKCQYCDFLSGPCDEETRAAYLAALCEEIEYYGENLSAQKKELETIFIGGGTPSLLMPDEFRMVWSHIEKCFFVKADAEITIECNPGTLDAEKLRVYRQLGINRISLGCQSADNQSLAKLGRIHTWEDFVASYQLVREAGFTNVNVDLMSALPGEKPEDFEKTLRQVLALSPQPEHLSCYSLIIEEGTPFYELDMAGELDLPSEEEDRTIYHRTREILEEFGYSRYEISNYAKEGFACRHNIGYWTGKEYLGIGIGAASYLKGCRFSNTSDLYEYTHNPIEKYESYEELSENDRMEEYMFLGLRMTCGVEAAEFERRFGKTMQEIYGKVLEKNIQDGLLIENSDEKNGKTYHLSERGLDLANYVFSQFLL